MHWCTLYRVITLHALTCACTIIAHSSIEYLGLVKYPLPRGIQYGEECAAIVLLHRISGEKSYDEKGKKRCSL